MASLGHSELRYVVVNLFEETWKYVNIFLSFPNIEMAQVVEMLPGPTFTNMV